MGNLRIKNKRVEKIFLKGGRDGKVEKEKLGGKVK